MHAIAVVGWKEHVQESLIEENPQTHEDIYLLFDLTKHDNFLFVLTATIKEWQSFS